MKVFGLTVVCGIGRSRSIKQGADCRSPLLAATSVDGRTLSPGCSATYGVLIEDGYFHHLVTFYNEIATVNQGIYS
jgi:hypothetical protein